MVNANILYLLYRMKFDNEEILFTQWLSTVYLNIFYKVVEYFNIVENEKVTLFTDNLSRIIKIIKLYK